MWSFRPCRWRRLSQLFAGILLACASFALADPTTLAPPQPPASGQPMTTKTKQEILHVFTADLVYIRTNFPMGRSGLKLKDGSLTPSGEDLQALMSLWGPAAKPGDQARISDITIKPTFIRFEINGGPVKRGKWYQHIQIQGAQPATVTPGGEVPTNPHGSYVDLCFDKFVPDMTGPELKALLRPVFDFDSKNGLEAFLDTVPPKVKDAIQHHQILVGMNQQMVIYSKGRPPRRIREQADGTDYEEWIFGVPPQDVDFVRFVGDEVVRVETMKVDGQKVVRVDREVDLDEPKVAKTQVERRDNAPTLRRPGEEMPDSKDQNRSVVPVMPPPDMPAPPGGDPGPNWLPTQMF